jgi:hypothetical protein
MLTLDRFDAGELEVDACDAVIEHLRLCPTCTSRLEEVQAEATVLEPAIAGRIERDPTRSVAVAIASSLAAAAAVLLLVGWPRAEQASRVMGGSELTASAYTTTTAMPEELERSNLQLRARVGDRTIHPQDYVPADATLAIDLATATPGYVAVLREGEPQDNGEGTGGMVSAPLDVVVGVTEASSLERPIQLQSEPLSYGATKTERVIAVFCPEPFTLPSGGGDQDILTQLESDNCESVELAMTWAAEAADS